MNPVSSSSTAVDDDMQVSSSEGQSPAVDWPERWAHINHILTSKGPLNSHEFEPSEALLPFLLNECRILVIGAGGLGCELLKNLTLMGFRKIDVIDMDKIELSNLNRQFLFRPKDIGSSKAEVAAAFINARVRGAQITGHFKQIQDMDEDFYRSFHIIVCGLDSIVARRWINGLVLSLLNYDADGNLQQSSIIPLIDGGTEGFKGNLRVILPGLTPCIECTLDLYPPPINFPLCTLAHTPRLPEHCIEYAKVLLWPKEWPFGEGVAVDGDEPAHISWLFDRANERAAEFGIEGVTARLTAGVVKRIIPAVASTNAIIAAAAASEAFKLATTCFTSLNNYFVFNNSDGIYSYSYEAERKEDCIVCSSKPMVLRFSGDAKLDEVRTHLIESPSLQMKAPALTTINRVTGKSQTLYMSSNAFLEAKTKENLKKSLTDLGLADGQQLFVTDITSPNSLIFQLKFV